MSTTAHENHCLPRIFKGRRERTGHPKKCGALSGIKPYLQKIWFKGESLLRTFARNFSNIDFFLKILPLKYDELAMSEM